MPEKTLSLLSRLGYILGNLMAKYDNARIQVYIITKITYLIFIKFYCEQFYHNDVAMEYLLTVLELNVQQSLELKNNAGDSVLDVLIKMIRVVANMSVNTEVGFGLGSARTLGAILMKLIEKTCFMKCDEEVTIKKSLIIKHILIFSN